MKRLGIFPLVFFLYAWLFPWLPELRSPNELSRYYQTRAIVEYGSIALNEVIAKSGPVGT